MFSYYIRLSWRSIKRTPLLVSLVILTLAIGVATLSANLALLQTMAADPVPGKSESLYHLSMSTWPNANSYHKQPLYVHRYREVRQVLQSDIPTHAMASYSTHLYTKVMGSQQQQRASADVLATTPDFFAMSRAPFAYGQGFSSASGTDLVIGYELNLQLFAGKNSVGKTLDIEGNPYRIVGVLKPWVMKPKFYNMEQQQAFAPTEDLFVPLETAIDHNWRVRGMNTSADFQGELAESREYNSFYLLLWVQLDSAKQKADFQRFLNHYCLDLKNAGEHPLPVINELNSVSQWADKQEVVDERVLAFTLATALFLLVCAFNASSLLLGKYHGERFEMGLRRAVGASRSQLLQQGVVESLFIGLLAGLLACGFSWAFIELSASLLPDFSGIAQIDLGVLLQSSLLTLVVALVSTCYPLLKASREAIAMELK